ncbi:hypothetical protein NNJEOMEG_00691 [Fundidesulfovibrio magnetotacticus]|uniref:Secondary thiamine-phosphate synthase enzyme n=1 Tax=Fundidesulfovibrio magnetotacticus TaxID=2730080 RepID=A0A6V8LJG1_9BACT|nr:secondary thiamine-phosphate synthase enzyme YjbQ [Fundidesulfovibrio magnetotacticus]GFK92863.1 hypothetical protein NNJEOMEG_00691 [Fundidesulfovibrio magnetotacticus]
MLTLTVTTLRREELKPITRDLQQLATANGWSEGVLTLFCPHTTAGLTVNENADPDVARDMLDILARLVPQRGGYRHAEGNSDAHVKASLMGPSLSLIVSGGRIRLGTWQGVYFCEFDGPRERTLWAQWTGT